TATLPARLAGDVEARLPAADEFQLAQDGGELVGRLLPDEGARVLDNLAGLLVAAGAEVAEQPGAQRARLADVDQFTGGVEHAVDAGQARAVLAHGLAQAARAAGADGGERRFGAGQRPGAEAGEPLAAEQSLQRRSLLSLFRRA